MRLSLLCGVGVAMLIFSWSTRYYYLQSISWKDKAIEANKFIRQQNRKIDILQNQHRKLAELDEYYTGKLNEAENENMELRTQLSMGNRRMFVKGKHCDTRSSSASASGMGHDGTFELSADTGQNILSIREGIIHDQQKLRYLQNYIRQFCHS